MADLEPASLVVEDEAVAIAPLLDVTADLLPAFADAARAMAPHGRAWNLRDGSVLMQVLTSLARAALDVEMHLRHFRVETTPDTAFELLAEWERSLGLPDDCRGPLTSADDRRAAVVARLVGLQGSSEPELLAYLAALGFAVSIRHYKVCRTEFWQIGEPLLDPAWQFTIEVLYFGAGDRELLRCALSHRLAAHVAVVFCFGDFTPADVIVEDEVVSPGTIF